jgi:hypothetical protein
MTLSREFEQTLIVLLCNCLCIGWWFADHSGDVETLAASVQMCVCN